MHSVCFLLALFAAVIHLLASRANFQVYPISLFFAAVVALVDYVFVSFHYDLSLQVEVIQMASFAFVMSEPKDA